MKLHMHWMGLELKNLIVKSLAAGKSDPSPFYNIKKLLVGVILEDFVSFNHTFN